MNELVPMSRRLRLKTAFKCIAGRSGACGTASTRVFCTLVHCADRPARLQDHGDSWPDVVKVYRMMEAFRRRGHLAAKLDPIRGSGHRKLSPLEPINWRFGGPHGPTIDNLNVNRLLRDPAKIDLDIFSLGHYSPDSPLPAGIDVPPIWGRPPLGGDTWTFKNLVEHLRRCYANTLGLEHHHVENEGERRWLEQRVESRFGDRGFVFDPEARKAALQQLARADQLERLFGEKFPSAKQFGVRGLEVLLPCIWTITERLAELDVSQLQLGMAHRGRLNVLVNFLGKQVSEVCSEFNEQVDFLGDMKYHLGTRGSVSIAGRKVQLTLAPNPSHLEAVNPVVLGMTRAKQDYGQGGHGSMALLIHGDAAFSGQGITAECMQLADLPGYSTGGTLHIVLNNMIGFTTDPRAARSSYHCTNVAKVNSAPIIHVNGDDVDSVLFAARLAAEYRQTFRQDIVIDIVGYRRYGHSEVDDDSLTQPLTRRITQLHPSVFKLYSDKLIEERIVTEGDVQAWVNDISAEYEAGYQRTLTSTTVAADWQSQDADGWLGRPVNITGLPESRLVSIGKACNRIPDGFSAHNTVEKIFAARLRMLEQGYCDWALAEQLAIGSLLLDYDPHCQNSTGLMKHAQHAQHVAGSSKHDAGSDSLSTIDCYVNHPPCPVRLSGQDVERGTFNQRHATIHDQVSAVPHNVFSNLDLGPQSVATVVNSSLSEQSILGFEYGYSLEESLSLTIWEAQFGDFANCAQHIIDNFIASGESKWNTKSCLVLMLPHGFEGQGADHSSARLERFLQLVNDDPDDLWGSADSPAGGKQITSCSKEACRDAVAKAIAARSGGNHAANMRAVRNIALHQEMIDYGHNIGVVNLTTPSNLFHALRRQVHRTFAKPLVLMSPKYLLHHRPCRSQLSDLSSGTRLIRVIPEDGIGDNMPPRTAGDEESPKRLIFCSGKIFYELHHARKSKKLVGSIVFARLEQIAPFPSMEVSVVASRYPDAEILWVQEEPKNMGAWSYVGPRLRSSLKELLDDDREVRYVGRRAAANLATPLFKVHRREIREIIDTAVAVGGD